MEWAKYECIGTPVVMDSMINRCKNLSTFKKVKTWKDTDFIMLQ